MSDKQKKLLSFILLSIVSVFTLFIIFCIFTFTAPVPNFVDKSSSVSVKDLNIKGFQIRPSGDEILMLSKQSNHQDVYLYTLSNKHLQKLNHEPLPLDSEKANLKGYAGTYIDEEGNTYFRYGLVLTIISPDNTVSQYNYLDSSLLYSEDELTNKTTSKLFKQIIDKYSTTQITKIIFPKLYDQYYIYLINLDKNYYMETILPTLELEWFLPGKYVQVVIRKSISIQPYTLRVVNPINPQKLEYLEDNTHYNVGGNLQASIIRKCYPQFNFIGDGSPCRARRTFLYKKFKRFVLPVDIYDFYQPNDQNINTKDNSILILSSEGDLYFLK